ncbi:MAG TPA: MG2 domain-containing protein, partial [Anaerolineaceae bacterium]
MSRKILVRIAIAVLLVGSVIGLVYASAYYSNLPNNLSQHETIVLGQTTYTPGSQAALRVLVRDSKNGSPLEGAQVSISMRPKAGGPAVALFKGSTDQLGTTNVTFKVPITAAPDQTLVVETTSKLGQDTVERPVTVERDSRVLLTTDKPIYQPGQVIHLRALALNSFDLSPASNQALEITIADGKGNKVFRQTLTTSGYGVASTDFQLASEVNSGAYKITAKLGNTNSETTVTVEAYTLPKFQISLKTDKTFYLPGKHVSGVLNAGYFFGKPVAGGKVVIEGFTFDVDRTNVVHLEGQTDADGNFNFEFDLPTFIAGTELDKGTARFYVQATVTDLAQSSEVSNLSIPVAGSALVVDAIPEGGQFMPGVDNILYVMVSYPDGSPAEAALDVNFINSGKVVSVNSGLYGLAEVHYTPDNPYQSVTIQARDKQGNQVTRQLNFEGVYSEETVLLRPEQPVYKVGEPMYLEILTSASTGTVYLDIVRAGQTVSTRSVDVKGGKAALAVDLTPDLYGTIELHAYKILNSGNIVRDTRLVVVDQAEGLKIGLTPGQNTYKPGDPGKLDINVQGNDGKGAQAALGIAVVDESVFALAQQDPGFARLYFMLEQDLLQPKYDLHGYSLSDLVRGTLPADDPALSGAVAGAAQASLAVSAVNAADFALQVNSHQDNIQKAQKIQEDFFGGLANGLMGIMFIIPLAILGLNGFALWKQKALGYSLLLLAGLVAVVVLFVLFWPLGADYQWAQTPADRLNVFSQMLFNNGSTWVGILGLLALACIFILLIYAIQKKDSAIGWSLLLVVLFVGAAILLVNSLLHTSKFFFQENPALLLIALGLVPLAFLLRFAGFAWQRQAGMAVATLLVAFFMLFGLMPLLQTASYTLDGVGAMGGRPEIMNFAAGDKNLRMAVPGGPPMLGATAPAATQAAAATAAPAGGQQSASPAAAEPPRLRQYFPETMLWLPEA